MRNHAASAHGRHLGNWYTCPECDEPFHDSSTSRTYCSRSCATTAQNQARSEGTLEHRECRFCGLSLWTYTSEDSNYHLPCWHESRRESVPDGWKQLVRDRYTATSYTVNDVHRLCHGYGYEVSRTTVRDELADAGVLERTLASSLEQAGAAEVGQKPDVERGRLW